MPKDGGNELYMFVEVAEGADMGMVVVYFYYVYYCVCVCVCVCVCLCVYASMVVVYFC